MFEDQLYQAKSKLKHVTTEILASPDLGIQKSLLKKA